jgi:hypothetical protein
MADKDRRLKELEAQVST